MYHFEKNKLNAKSAREVATMDFFTKIVGVTYDNRQQLIASLKRNGRLSEGTDLYLIREPQNQYDRNAIAVKTYGGDQLGYLAKDVAKQLAYEMDSGIRYSAIVSAITGGDSGLAYGINIRVFVNQTATKYEEEYEEECEDQEDETEENDTYSRELFNFVKEELEGNWKVEANPNTGSIFVRMVGIDASIESVTTCIDVREKDCVYLATYDNFKISREKLNRVAELLMKIDVKYVYNHLFVDYNYQNICCIYKPSFCEDYYHDGDATKAFIETGIQLQRWANAILSVSLGLQSPDEAIARVNTDD